MKKIAYYDGKFGAPEELVAPVLDRAFYFGDGCYDATMVVNQHPLDFEDHLNRFFNSMRLMEIEPSFTREELTNTLLEAVSRCYEGAAEGTAFLYWQCSRATAPRGHAYPATGEPNLFITVSPKALPDYVTPAPMITVPDLRFFYCNIKTLNLFPNVQANQRAHAAGAYEAIFVRPASPDEPIRDTDIVTEGSHCNICLLKDGVLYTHEDGKYVLPGITKMHVMNVARSLGIPVREEAFTLGFLKDADEVFATGSTTFTKRCNALDGEPIGMKDEALYKKLSEAYAKHCTDQGL